MSSIPQFSALPSWPYLFAGTVAWMPIGFFIGAQTRYARAMCAQAGFAQPLPPSTPQRKGSQKSSQDSHDELNSLFYLLANKEAVIGVVLLALQAAGEWKAAGIMLGITCVAGLGDMYVAVRRGSFGVWQAFKAIGFVKCIGTWAAWRIYQENC